VLEEHKKFNKQYKFDINKVQQKRKTTCQDPNVGIFYYLIIFQYHYVGKYRNNNYISYLSIVSLNWLVIKLSNKAIRFLIG